MSMDDFIAQDTAGGRTMSSAPLAAPKPAYTPPTGGLFSQLGSYLAKEASHQLRKTPGRIFRTAVAGPLGFLLDKEDRNMMKDTAVGMVGAIPKVAIQMPRAFAAGVAGTAGNTELEARFSKPVDVPVMGKVKGLSAVPSDAKNYGTQTNLETGMEAVDLFATAGMPGVAKPLEKVTGKVMGKVLDSGPVKGLIEKFATKETAKVVSQDTSKTLKAVSPMLSDTEKIAAAKQGRAIAPTLFEGLDISPSAYEKKVAETAHQFYDSKATHVENIGNMNKAIEAEAEALKATIKGKDPIFNTNQLKTKLLKMEIGPQVAADPVIAKQHEMAVGKYLDFLAGEKNNISGALDARKKFDGWLLDNYPNLYTSERLSPLKQTFKNIRNGVNDFIADKIPDVAYKDSLKKQSFLFEARDNLAERAVKEGKFGKAVQWSKSHPVATKAAKLGLTIGGVGVVGREIIP